VFFLLLFARRFAQLLHPQVWDEDFVIIAAFVNQGPLAVFVPLNGYLVIASKLVSLIALLFPFALFPLISTIIAWLFTVFVCIALSVCPTMLRGGPLLALAVLLVPSDAEVFGIPLYTLWWASLLLFVVAFWRAENRSLRVRIAFTIIGGLSAPTVLLTAPLAVLRAVFYRNRAETLVMATCVTCAIIQVLCIVKTAGASSQSGIAILTGVIGALPKFVGSYAVGNLVAHHTPLRAIAIGIAMALPLVIILATWFRSPSQRIALVFLSYCWVGAVVFSCLRVNPAIIDPVLAGPRYFFFPYLLEGWLLIQVGAQTGAPILRTAAAALLVLSVFNVLPVLSRSHDDFLWQQNVANCAAVPGNGTYAIPVEFAGSAAASFHLVLTGEECRRLDRFGLMGLELSPTGSPKER
jgi:hypothetical protein